MGERAKQKERVGERENGIEGKRKRERATEGDIERK